ncbi:hypothetical protein [Bradyrhizobium monzae]|uniref:hypothetical protein n=1 Tax=Bradyrhizobium sp. Oc8 TaxID=2876780 RepID=UPI001F17AC3A|nr:hypothetical protein [Bradyrhizobium sp. Oc8]
MVTVPQDHGVEVDSVSFQVRAQKFRVAAMIMKRTRTPVATEFATRLVHLVKGIRLDDMAGFFDFEPSETKVLLEDVLGTGLVSERNGQLVLSERGQDALSPSTDTLDLYEVEELVTTISFDLAAFAPVEESKLNPREARIVEELKLPDREKAAAAAKAAENAFELHFHEWRQRYGRRAWDEETRLHSIDDVQSIATFPAVFQMPVRWRSGDMAAVEADFSELAGKGRAGSRNALISALSTRLKDFAAPSDHAVAFELVSELDGGVFRRDGVRSTQEVSSWADLCGSIQDRALPHPAEPGLRVIGSTATTAVRAALLDWTQSIGGAQTATKAPVFWLPPESPSWGRSLPFASLAAALSTAHASDDGTVLLARTRDAAGPDKFWSKLYGPTGSLSAVFDRCLAVPAMELPNALELIVKPGSWAFVLVHAPDPATGYPFPLGYITAARAIVDRFSYQVAELASKADGTRAIAWHRSKEDAHAALAMIDEALGIGVA